LFPSENRIEDEHLSHEDEYACSAIQSLVCGLPTNVERERYFVVLRVCIDDSGTGRGPHQPWFILGGYLARARNWKGFADDWQGVLRGPPGLAYIKAQEAYHGSGQFELLKWPERDARMAECKAFIEKHVIKRVSFSLRYADYDAILNLSSSAMKTKVHEDFRNPYTFSLAAIVAQTIGDRVLKRQPHEKIEFIFDCGFEDRERLEEGYAKLMQIFAQNLPKRICDLIGVEPIFRPAREFLPLQAADLGAWGIRRFRNNKAIPDWLPRLEDRENIDIEYTRKDLRDVFLNALKALLQ
jgi:hypothetical protein